MSFANLPNNSVDREESLEMGVGITVLDYNEKV